MCPDELNLLLNEEILARRIQYLDKTVAHNIKTEIATYLSLQRLSNSFSAEIAYVSANVKEITDILQLNENLEKLVNIMLKIMEQHENKDCLTLKEELWCLNFLKSSVRIQGTKIEMSLQVSKPITQMSNYITCIPLLETNQVSILHNTHLTVKGNDFIGKNILISKDKISDIKYANENTREIMLPQ